MSRVDIAITEKKTNNLLFNRGFCRSPALESFCENTSNKKLQAFDYEIGMGIDLDEKKFHLFMDTINYVINYLEAIPLTERKDNFDWYDEDYYCQFIEDLKESILYLKDFGNTHNLEEYKITIV